MDMRGHGGSLPEGSAFELEDLAQDVVLVLDALEIDRVDYLGLSIGGMVGQALALNHPERVGRLVLANTTSRIPDEAQAMWENRIRDVLTSGVESQVVMTLERWFTAEFSKENPGILDWIAGMVRKSDPVSFAACCRAISHLNFLSALHTVTSPCLVVSAEKDEGTPPERGGEIADRIEGAHFGLVTNASHLSNVEQPDEFNRWVLPFLLGEELLD